jgi:hypothetical protein
LAINIFLNIFYDLKIWELDNWEVEQFIADHVLSIRSSNLRPNISNLISKLRRIN